MTKYGPTIGSVVFAPTDGANVMPPGPDMAQHFANARAEWDRMHDELAALRAERDAALDERDAAVTLEKYLRGRLAMAEKLLRWWQKHHGSDAMTDQFLAGADPERGAGNG